jgi:HTH-type transcriptional regulator, competence development regulator
MSTHVEREALGDHLRAARKALGMTLADVEEATDGISALYVCELEEGRVKFPAPHVLHALAGAYVISYVNLMQLAGHIRPKPLTGEINPLGP